MLAIDTLHEALLHRTGSRATAVHKERMEVQDSYHAEGHIHIDTYVKYGTDYVVVKRVARFKELYKEGSHEVKSTLKVQFYLPSLRKTSEAHVPVVSQGHPG